MGNFLTGVGAGAAALIPHFYGRGIAADMTYELLAQGVPPSTYRLSGNSARLSFSSADLGLLAYSHSMFTNTQHFMKSRRDLNRGFSLIEVMVVVAIIAILGGLAAPEFAASIKRYRVNALSEELIGSIQLARSEAIRRGFPVLMVRTTGCGATLVDANDWSCGWEIVVDTNSNGAKTTGEPVLQVFSVVSSYGVMHPGLGDVMQLNVWGQAQGVGQRFVLTPPEGVSGTATTTLCLNAGGRIRKLVGDATCP